MILLGLYAPDPHPRAGPLDSREGRSPFEPWNLIGIASQRLWLCPYAGAGDVGVEGILLSRTA